MSAFVIDAFEFCKNDGHREGSTPLVDMTRLAAESTDKSGEIRWSMQGGQTRQGYPSLTLVRPGLIGGQRDDFRPMERVSDAILTVLGPVLPRQWRISPAANIAAALIEAALAARPGRHVVSAAQLA